MTFVPELPALLTFTLAVVVLAVTPGPDMTFFLAKAVSGGRRAGLAAMGGALTGLFLHTAAAAVGLSALLAASPGAFNVLKVIGSLYLLWLAISVLRSGSGLKLDEENRKPESLKRIYLAGLGINILNPKIILFFVTFLPQFVSPGDPNADAKLAFLGVWFIVTALPIVTALVLFVDRIALHLAKNPRAMRLLDYLFAGVMGGFALKLALARAG
ncbi:MAG: LysE family translocator [Hyphomicrobiales bacterium]|nr:MAG: LysE family translocator [Hyphomicrobiales bacterium]